MVTVWLSLPKTPFVQHVNANGQRTRVVFLMITTGCRSLRSEPVEEIVEVTDDRDPSSLVCKRNAVWNPWRSQAALRT